MAAQQTVIIVPSPSVKPEDARDLIHKVTGSECFKWHIDNKYYETDIEFRIHNKTEQSTFVEAEAVILMLDAKQDKLSDLNVELMENIGADVQLLVCEQCGADDESEAASALLSRIKVLEWCVDKQLELVEMVDPEENEDKTAVEEFSGDYGVGRIREALHAHAWPELTMKEPEAKKKEEMTSVVAAAAKEKEKEEVLQAEERDEAEQEKDEEDMDAAFEELMSKMMVFKKECSSKQTDEERIKYAENVTKAFWKVMGGDEGEFESD